MTLQTTHQTQHRSNTLTQLKKILALLLLLATVPDLFGAESSPETKNTDDQSLNFTHYKYDAGVIFTIDKDGRQTEENRISYTMGLRFGYHLTPNWMVQAEYNRYIYVQTKDTDLGENIRADYYLVNAVYDFSPERRYSLYALLGVGYKHMTNIYHADPSGGVFDVGLGLRYLFFKQFSGTIEGRWIRRFDIDDNTFNGGIGLNYHF